MRPWIPEFKSRRGHPPALPPPALEKEPCAQQYERGVEEQRLEPVEEAAVARQETARVLGAIGALDHRLGEVAERPQDGGSRADDHRAQERQRRQEEVLHHAGADDGSERAPDRSLPG